MRAALRVLPSLVVVAWVSQTVQAREMVQSLATESRLVEVLESEGVVSPGA